MAAEPPLIFGPAYLDLAVTLDHPLCGPAGRLFDQSLPAARMTPRTDGRIAIVGPTGDRLRLTLPAEQAACAAT